MFWEKLGLRKNKEKKSSDISLPPKLIELLGFTPKYPAFFREAFIPKSAQTHRDGKVISYERLEFLGDAILGAVIADYLFREAPLEKEGYLTKMRSKIVSRKKLNEVGNRLGLVNWVDEDLRKKQSLSSHIAGDLFEALVGAIYLEKGFVEAEAFISKQLIQPYVDLQNLEKTIVSHKSLMIEYCQKNKLKIRFKTSEQHCAEQAKMFHTVLWIGDEVFAKGRAPSKKKAEESAAKRAYFRLQDTINAKVDE